jgi:hypothetical protein
MQAGQYKMDNKELMITFMRVLYRDDNTILRYKMFDRVTKRTSPILTKVIEQGVFEGVFDTPSAEEAGEFILRVGRSINEVVVKQLLDLTEKPEKKDLLKNKLLFYQHSMERILGAPQGSINLLDKGMIETFLEWEVKNPGDSRIPGA